MNTREHCQVDTAPAISVVIPLYNKAPYVRRAIETVLSQTFQDIEIVIVDDGSTDGGGQLVREMGNSKCRLFTQPNAGECAARNKGVELARSDLVAFLDADDEWRPDFLATSLALHQRFPEIVASFTNYYRSDIHMPALPQRAPGGVLPSYFEFCFRNGGSGMWVGAIMARRSAVLKAGGFPVGRKIGGDLDTWFRLACEGPVAYEPKPLAVYFIDRGICSTSPVNTDIWATYQEWLRAGRIPKAEINAAERFVSILRLITVVMRCRHGEVAQARRMLSEIPRWRCWSMRRLACVVAAWAPLLPPRYWLGAAYRLGVPLYWRVTYGGRA